MILQTYGKEIVALLVPLVTWLLNVLFRAKARLAVAQTHAFMFLVQEPLLDKDGKQLSPSQTMHVSSYYLSNMGREAATNVEVVLNWKPFCINLWPARHYDERLEKDGRFTLTFSSLSPKESIGLEMFCINGNAPSVLIARCQQCVGQFTQLAPQPVVSTWKRRIAVFLLFAGMAACIYIIIIVIQFLVLKTPLGH